LRFELGKPEPLVEENMMMKEKDYDLVRSLRLSINVGRS
jgi:hypothetical protein